MFERISGFKSQQEYLNDPVFKKADGLYKKSMEMFPRIFILCQIGRFDFRGKKIFPNISGFTEAKKIIIQGQKMWLTYFIFYHDLSEPKEGVF